MYAFLQETFRSKEGTNAQNCCAHRLAKIQPKHGGRIEVSNGQTITVVDVDGGQVADFFAEVKDTHEEYLSLFVTIDCNESLRIGVGSILYSNLYHAMFEVIQDDV